MLSQRPASSKVASPSTGIDRRLKFVIQPFEGAKTVGDLNGRQHIKFGFGAELCYALLRCEQTYYRSQGDGELREILKGLDERG
jgi:hypothetical protein